MSAAQSRCCNSRSRTIDLMVNHSPGGSSSLGTCKFTFPWLVDASTRNGASPPGAQPRITRASSTPPRTSCLGQLAGPQRPALVHLVWILAAERAAADRHARTVMVDNELLSRKSVVPNRAADSELPRPIENEPFCGEGRSRSLQSSVLQLPQNCPAQDYAGLIDSSANELLGQLGGPAAPRTCPPCADPCRRARRRRSARPDRSGR